MAKFPIFWTILLVFGIAWLLDETGYLNIQLPWGPVILVIIALGMIYNRMANK
jgi:hypothetical protein